MNTVIHLTINNIRSSFPRALRSEVEKVIEILPIYDSDIPVSIRSNIFWKNESLTNIYRIYFDEPMPDAEAALSSTQRTILHCIYLRHCNGLLRQKRLEQVIEQSDLFIIPFTFQLAGEYVIEIFETLEKHVRNNVDLYIEFTSENPVFWKQTQARMISYWNEYYRGQFPRRKDYPGQRIVEILSR